MRARGPYYVGLGAISLLLMSGVTEGAPGDFTRVPADVVAAQQRGPVRVIVRLVQPAGTPITQAQDALLAELTGTTCRVLHRYLTSPFMALEVGEDALRVLDRSPNVVSVAGDVEAHTQSPAPKR